MAAENRDFGRFVTNWYSVHCKHTRFFEFLGLLNEGFWKEAWFWGVRVGFGGREGALASALITVPFNKNYLTVNEFATFSVGHLTCYVFIAKSVLKYLLPQVPCYYNGIVRI